MADADARIMDMVRKELEKDRSVATGDLFEKAKKIDPGVADLTSRQFHAKYPLQVKRALKGGGRRGTKKAAGGRKRAAGKRGGAKRTRTTGQTGRTAARKSDASTSGQRDRKRATNGRRRRASAAPAANGTRGDVRGLLLQFAKQVAQADDKAEMVDVLAGIDTWVDRMVAAAATS